MASKDDPQCPIVVKWSSEPRARCKSGPYATNLLVIGHVLSFIIRVNFYLVDLSPVKLVRIHGDCTLKISRIIPDSSSSKHPTIFHMDLQTVDPRRVLSTVWKESRSLSIKSAAIDASSNYGQLPWEVWWIYVTDYFNRTYWPVLCTASDRSSSSYSLAGFFHTGARLCSMMWLDHGSDGIMDSYLHESFQTLLRIKNNQKSVDHTCIEFDQRHEIRDQTRPTLIFCPLYVRLVSWLQTCVCTVSSWPRDWESTSACLVLCERVVNSAERKR